LILFQSWSKKRRN